MKFRISLVAKFLCQFQMRCIYIWHLPLSNALIGVLWRKTLSGFPAVSVNKQLYFKCKSPGKIIISGEHAVVYDMKAIACAINLYTNCNLTIIQGKSHKVKLILRNLESSLDIDINKLILSEAYLELLKNNKIFEEYELSKIFDLNIFQFINLIDAKIDKKTIQFVFLFNIIYAYFRIITGANENILWDFFNYYTFEIDIFSEIPHGAGLGSSAAFTINLTAAILKIIYFVFAHYDIHNNILDKYEYYLNSFSYIGEKYFHNKPSGLDNTVSLSGGAIVYQKMFMFQMLPDHAYHNLKNFNIYLIDSKLRRDTQHFIEIVRSFKEKHSKVFYNSIDSINCLVEELSNLLVSKEFRIEEFNDIISINQNLLDIIQVSTIELDNIVNCLKNVGIAGKITGAGGGGFLLAFVPHDRMGVFQEIIEKNGYYAHKCEIVKRGFEIIEDSIIGLK